MIGHGGGGGGSIVVHREPVGIGEVVWSAACWMVSSEFRDSDSATDSDGDRPSTES